MIPVVWVGMIVVGLKMRQAVRHRRFFRRIMKEEGQEVPWEMPVDSPHRS
jgi:hypothetical protein